MCRLSLSLAKVDTPTVGELVAAFLVEGVALSSPDLSAAGYALLQQWVQILLPKMKHLADIQPPPPQKQKDLLQHGYYDWVLAEMQAAPCQHCCTGLQCVIRYHT